MQVQDKTTFSCGVRGGGGGIGMSSRSEALHKVVT